MEYTYIFANMGMRLLNSKMFHQFKKKRHCLAWREAVSCGLLSNIQKNTIPHLYARS